MAFKYSLVNDWRLSIEIIEFIDEIYKKNARTPETTDFWNYGLCKKYSKITEMIVKFCIAFYALIAIVMVLYTGANLFLGVKDTPLRIHFPGLNDATDTGFAILYGLNILLLVFYYFTICSCDMLIYVIFANVPMIASIIIHQLDELKVALLDPECPSSEIKYRILNIILMHKKYNEYVKLYMPKT